MIAVISDVHSNLAALRAVLARIDALGCDDILSLGDVVGYCAQPAECVELLRERDVVNILGNHDQYIASGSGCPRSRLVSEICAFQQGKLSPEDIDWLSASRSRVVRGAYYFVHGGWEDPVDQYLYEVGPKDIPAEAEILFAGHTHVQTLLHVGEKLFCNPGSVGQPRDGNPRAAFATLSDGEIELHRVEYDIDETAFHIRQAGFPARCYENLYIGAQIGGRIDRVALAPNQR